MPPNSGRGIALTVFVMIATLLAGCTDAHPAPGRADDQGSGTGGTPDGPRIHETTTEAFFDYEGACVNGELIGSGTHSIRYGSGYFEPNERSVTMTFNWAADNLLEEVLAFAVEINTGTAMQRVEMAEGSTPLRLTWNVPEGQETPQSVRVSIFPAVCTDEDRPILKLVDETVDVRFDFHDT